MNQTNTPHADPVEDQVVTGVDGEELSELISQYEESAKNTSNDKDEDGGKLRTFQNKIFKGVLRYYGVEEDIFKSIVEFLTDEPTDETLAMMVRTNMIHSKRRGDEICEIAEMEKEAGLENTMAEAATKKLYWLADLGLKEKFGGKKAETLNDALDAVLAAQGKK